MKIATILGTRPEIIRLSIIIRRLDTLCKHVLIHTGQNFEHNLSDLFFQQLDVRKPDYFLGAKGGFGEQVGRILFEVETALRKESPDAVLILGDTNSGLSSIVAKKLGIPVFHMEAGNRCYDDRVPEEVNRRLIDHVSTVLLPYTEGSRRNLLREGVPSHSIFVTGNPIREVIQRHERSIDGSDALSKLGLNAKQYFLLTMHRAENVDKKERLDSILKGLCQLHEKYKIPIICSLHPRTQEKIKNYQLEDTKKHITFMSPIGFFEFVALEKQAFCVLSDSGTVQEECCLFRTPTVTLRDVTERPETIECGSNILSGADPNCIMRCVDIAVENPKNWIPPQEYLRDNVAQTVTNIIFGYNR